MYCANKQDRKENMCLYIPIKYELVSSQIVYKLGGSFINFVLAT